MITKQWVDKYRPKHVSDIIFGNDRTQKLFESYVAAKQFPSVLVHGPRGTGKTTLSKALVRDCGVEKLDTLYIPCSDEQIAAIREKVASFCTTMPYGEFKVVQLEEIDYLSPDAQALLRTIIQDFSSTCRFIATCNYLNKVLPPLQDRFHLHHFAAPDRDGMLLRAAEILEENNIEFTIEDIERIVAAAYPSMRRVVHLLEGSSTTGKLQLVGAAAADDWKLQLLPILEMGDLKAARKLVCESATKEELIDVYRFLFDNLSKVPSLSGKEDEAVVLLARYQYQHAFVADGELNLAALFVELGSL